MTRDEYPSPLSDPEAEGLPAHADDDSFADPDAQSSRAADDPVALPGDRPAAVEEYGTTAEEQRQGESLDERLGREEPDPALTGDVLPDPLTEEPAGADPGADERADPRLEGILEADDPATVSAVSVYERLGETGTGGQVGRLVEPDEGAHPDAEADAIAADRGPAGGGASAEERALHEDA
jgi:hypothetical protein